ncbi:MAG: PrsW family glutamic-type intramembrane protease [Phycisphaeraceae bacterium]
MDTSIPIRSGWRLRVMTGTSIGREFDLPQGQYVLGSQSPATIVIPDPSIAPQHVAIDVRSDHVWLTDKSGRGFKINSTQQSQGRVGPGDAVLVGTFGFTFINPAVSASTPPSTSASAGAIPHRWIAKLRHWLTGMPLHVRVAVITGSVAVLLFALLSLTENINIVPVTLLAMSAVVPATAMTYLVQKYDKTGISFKTLAITFLAGGTVGIIATIISAGIGGWITGGFLLSAIFAGVWEEPGKFLGTAWRWDHPAYDRPMDGLILGTVSGFGFAVFETQGYILNQLLGSGLSDALYVAVLRAVTAPFGHGLWSGIICAAFWQCNRKLPQAIRDRSFQKAFLIAIGLHALWNSNAIIENLGFATVFASAYLSTKVYRDRLNRNGYASTTQWW